MTAQEIFNSAQNRYNNATEVLGKFSDMIAQATDGKFSTEIALVQFDCILQYILLHEAIADGEISKTERQFIDLITDRGDIFQAVKSKTGVEISWDELVGLDTETGMKLLSAITPVYAELLLDFVQSVAKVDGMIKDIDLLAIINESIVGIFADFACVDGDADDSERDVVINAYLKLFVEQYQQAVAEAEAE